MIGRVIAFDRPLDPAAAHAFMDAWKAAESGRARKDVLLNAGATVTDLSRTTPRGSFLRRARARVR